MPRQNLFLVAIIFAAAVVSLITALSPELGFDALWYHLPVVKLYLSAGQIFHIPGGLLYYSEMPRLVEMLYLVAMKLFPDLLEIGPHLVSWAAGIWSGVLLYKIARKYLPQTASLLAVAVFYVTPIVGWLSGSAYIDMTRTFFEILALYFALNENIIPAGLAAGLAVSTKTLSLGSVGILATVLFVLSRNWKKTIIFVAIAGLVSLPWFLSSYLNTGYPFYPVGTGLLDSSHDLVFRWSSLISDYWKLFLASADPISPLYLIFLPFFIQNLRSLRKLAPIIAYALLAYLVWWATPRTGGGRFILPYLGAFAILVAATLESQKSKFLKTVLLVAVVLVSLINVLYRGIANKRVLPYFLGRETRTEYLCKNLDFSTSVFVDCDGWFSHNIKRNDLVLISGIHNLYYVDFLFVHESWYRGEKVNYLLVFGPENNYISSNFPTSSRHLVYSNSQTNIKLYSL